MRVKSFSPFFQGILILILGLFAIKKYVVIAPIWLTSFCLISWFFMRTLKKSKTNFVLLLFFLSHFSYADNQGGLWNICALAAYMVIFLADKGRLEFKNRRDLTLLFALGLLVCNLVGWIFLSRSSYLYRVEGFMMMSSYLITFLIVSNLELSEEFFISKFSLISNLLIYLLFAALNQRFGWVYSKLPLLPPKNIENGLIQLTTNSDSVFGNSELYGEYSVLILIILLSLLRYNASSGYALLSKQRHYISIVIAILGTFLSGSRSSIILVVFVFVFFGLRSFVKSSLSRAYLRFVAYLSVAAFAVLVTRLDFGLQSSLDDLNKLENVEFTVENVVSGKAINRYETFLYALDRLDDESWFFGHGIGPLESNILAWWGYSTNTPYVDFHNLYYTMPMLYGYSGMIIFFCLIWVVIYRSVKSYTSSKTITGSLVSAMPLFWALFLVDEWKISMLRNPNYHMIVWIFLGLNIALVRYNNKYV